MDPIEQAAYDVFSAPGYMARYEQRHGRLYLNLNERLTVWSHAARELWETLLSRGLLPAAFAEEGRRLFVSSYGCRLCNGRGTLTLAFGDPPTACFECRGLGAVLAQQPQRLSEMLTVAGYAQTVLAVEEIAREVRSGPVLWQAVAEPVEPYDFANPDNTPHETAILGLGYRVRWGRTIIGCRLAKLTDECAVIHYRAHDGYVPVPQRAAG